MFDDVVEFHLKVLGQPAAESPTLRNADWLTERFRFLAEETHEFYEAGLAGDIVGAVDGLLDTIYVALGTLHIMGIPTQQCWDIVQKANMAKVRGMTKRGNAFDATKPEGWVPPEGALAAIILRRIDEA